MKRLYIVRHGETQWNKLRKVQGQSDIPLNEYGIHLAEQTAQGLTDTSFDLAYTSPLKRAKETAEIILAGRDVPLIEDERIKEMGFGAYEGICISGEQKDRESEKFNLFFTDTEHYVPIGGGESIPQVYERTEDFLKEMCTRSDLEGKQILVSSHGAAITALLNHIRGNMEVASFWKYEVPPNCAVTIVEIEDKIPRIAKEGVIYYKEAVKKWKVV